MKYKNIVLGFFFAAIVPGYAFGQDTVRFSNSHYIQSETDLSQRVPTDFLRWCDAIALFGPTQDTIYGVALSASDFVDGFYPTIYLYRVKWGSYPSYGIERIDSVHRYSRKIPFDYGIPGAEAYFENNPRYAYPKAYEYYFDTPYVTGREHVGTGEFCVEMITPVKAQRILYDYLGCEFGYLPDELVDSFARYFTYYRILMPLDSLIDNYYGSYAARDYMNFPANSLDSIRFSSRIIANVGPLFPIVRLWCGTPRLQVQESGDDTARLAWHLGEEPDGLQLAYGSLDLPPDSGTIVTLGPSDTAYTLSGLTGIPHYGVWLRKACRFTTASYDTLVWSEWSAPVDILTSAADTTTAGVGEMLDGGDFLLRPNPARNSVQVTLPPTAVGGRLSLCDLAGRELEAYSVQGPTLEIDVSHRAAGVYLVKYVTPSGISTRRLVVGS